MFNDTVRIQIYRRSKEVNVRLGWEIQQRETQK
jgi:hypothetical protein